VPVLSIIAELHHWTTAHQTSMFSLRNRSVVVVGWLWSHSLEERLSQAVAAQRDRLVTLVHQQTQLVLWISRQCSSILASVTRSSAEGCTPAADDGARVEYDRLASAALQYR